MSESIKLFFSGIVNSLNSDGYYNVVTAPKKMGSCARDITNSRKVKHQNKVIKVKYARQTLSTTE
mgnify:FL=1|jgi:hypothetical protein